MAYDADGIVIEYELSLTSSNYPVDPTNNLLCWDNTTGLDIYTPVIDYMTTGGKILFPIVYDFDGNAFDIDYYDIDFCVSQSSIPPHNMMQSSIGYSAAYKIHAVRPSEGDSAIELVLTDTLLPYKLDFVASPTKGRIPLLVNFVNLSQPIHDIRHFLWDFGDGSISTEESPTHIYTEVGTYSVVLMGIDMYNNRKFISRKNFYIQSVEEERFINKSTRCFMFGVPVDILESMFVDDQEDTKNE